MLAREIDQRSNIRAFGVVLCEMLTAAGSRLPRKDPKQRLRGLGDRELACVWLGRETESGLGKKSRAITAREGVVGAHRFELWTFWV